jgi:type IV pilus assembly protein PilA
LPGEVSRWHGRCIRAIPVGKGFQRGFTLVEMMIVIVIVGVLALLAVTGYRKIVQSAHVSEATGMVQNIRVAQEAYKSETQLYANISKSLTDWYPQGSAGPTYQLQYAWQGGSCACGNGVTWANLPLHVDGPVLFGYATIAGTTAAQPPASVTYENAAITLPSGLTTDWYVVTAAADLDGNPSTATLVVSVSWTNQVTVINEGQ